MIALEQVDDIYFFLTGQGWIRACFCPHKIIFCRAIFFIVFFCSLILVFLGINWFLRIYYFNVIKWNSRLNYYSVMNFGEMWDIGRFSKKMPIFQKFSVKINVRVNVYQQFLLRILYKTIVSKYIS